MLSLYPMLGIPKTPDALAAMDAAGDHAAGILFVAPDGDVLVMRRSSSEENYGGHWDLPGGKVEEDEEPEDGAEREAREETGASVGGKKKLIDRRVTPTGTTFHTFAQPATSKFAPNVSGEHSGYAWAPLGQLPQPVHPGLAATISERLHGERPAADMTPEDWTGLASGFLKWLSEEEREPEHAISATDSAVKLALDKESLREVDQDGRLRVGVSNISKATVNPYLGHEIPGWEDLGLDANKIYYLLRDPDELAKAAPTFNGVQLLRKHVPVSADDHQPWDVVGATGTDAEFVSPYLRNSLSVWAADAIADIASETKKELSCGYHYRPDMTPGIFDGTRYDGVMRDIVGNHVALVKDGRAGPDVVVGDSNQEIDEMTANADTARRIKAISDRALTVNALTAYLRPRLALDAKIGIAKIFEGVTGKNFKDKKGVVAERITAAAKGKLAKDASLSDVGKVLDMLEEHEINEGTDESVSPEQHNAMEAAAHGNSTLGIPEKVGKEFVSKDADVPAFLREKGMSEDDITQVMDMFSPKAAAADEGDKEDEKKDDAEKPAEDEDKDGEKDKEKDKDGEMGKDTVTKTAMDAAILLASDATAKRVRAEVLATQNAVRSALTEVRPYVGELHLAFDSADDVYRAAFSGMGIDVKDVHPSAFPTIMRLQPKPGARPNADRSSTLAVDAASIDAIAKLYPGLDRITSV